jgi:hypothetical protein
MSVILLVVILVAGYRGDLPALNRLAERTTAFNLMPRRAAADRPLRKRGTAGAGIGRTGGPAGSMRSTGRGACW